MGICSIHSFPTSYASVLYERASCGHVATVVAIGATLQLKAHYIFRTGGTGTKYVLADTF